MNTRKRAIADLESKRGLFFRIGLVVSLGLVLLAFDWRTHYDPAELARSFMPREPEFLEPVVILPEPATETAPKKVAVRPVPPQPVPQPVPSIEPVTPLPEPPVVVAPPVELPPKSAPEPAPAPVLIAGTMPEFPGGAAALDRYIRENTRYSPIARDNGIDGNVHVQFVVDTTGKVTQVTLKRGVHSALDREALRVVASMPDWIPGHNGGHRVAVIQTMPIHFRLVRD